ncbi:MAG: transcriptional regulator MarR family [Herbaspirillum sp.]|nr:transcriptional regulator MarR family [Herbaspirillum sp.]
MARMKKSTIQKADTQVILEHWQEVGLDDRLAHLIMDSSRALVRALQIRLIKHSTSFGHWRFLRVLWEKDGLTQRALSEQVGVMEPTTYAAIIAMEKLGYIERKQLAENKRNNYIFLTPAGRALKKKLVPLAEEVNDVAVRGITDVDVKTTRNVLFAMIENLAADEIASEGATRRMPSTRELGRLVTESAQLQQKKRRKTTE